MPVGMGAKVLVSVSKPAMKSFMRGVLTVVARQLSAWLAPGQGRPVLYPAISLGPAGECSVRSGVAWRCRWRDAAVRSWRRLVIVIDRLDARFLGVKGGNFDHRNHPLSKGNALILVKS
jgi:hypothetical protein